MEKSPVFGLRCCELLGSYDQELQCWRTSQLSFEWAAQSLLEVLPKSGMIVNGKLYRLPSLERRTSGEDGSVSLPTPTTDQRPQRYKQGGRSTLCAILEHRKMLPTPTASDAGPAAILNENTNIVYTGRGTPRKVSNNGVIGSLGLARTVMFLSTPTDSDSYNTPNKPAPKRKKYHHLNAIAGQTEEAEHLGKKARLSPRFVAWMMGFPIGWLD